MAENNKKRTSKVRKKNKDQDFLRVAFLLGLATRSTLIFFSKMAALFSLLINSGFSVRHWAVSSPRNALARIDCVRLLTYTNASLTYYELAMLLQSSEVTSWNDLRFL